jgi:hypothetical protein
MQTKIGSVLGVLIVAAPLCWAEEAAKTVTARPTARQLVERIKQNVHCEWSKQTVDTFKAGNPDAKVTGVATTFLATLDVLQRAAAAGKNFIITHEPTFYNHWDKTNSLEDDKVLAEKQAFIEKHGLVVWRFHDHWHRRRPDGITEGVLGQFGWEKHFRPNETSILELPGTTLQSLADELKKKAADESCDGGNGARSRRLCRTNPDAATRRRRSASGR